MEIISEERIMQLSSADRLKLRTERNAVAAMVNNQTPYVTARTELFGDTIKQQGPGLVNNIGIGHHERHRRTLALSLPVSWFLIGQCEECGAIQTTSSKSKPANRFACKNIVYRTKRVECGYLLIPLVVDMKSWTQLQAKYDKWVIDYIGDRDEAADKDLAVWADEMTKGWDLRAMTMHFSGVDRNGCSIQGMGVECSWCENRDYLRDELNEKLDPDNDEKRLSTSQKEWIKDWNNRKRYQRR